MNFSNKYMKFKELEENVTYQFTQNEGYSDGISIRKKGNKILIGHFWLNSNEEIDYRLDDKDNFLILMDLNILNILKSGKYNLEYLDVNIFDSIDELDIWDIYNDIYLEIYNYIWGPGELKEEDKEYFKTIYSSKNYEEVFSEVFL